MKIKEQHSKIKGPYTLSLIFFLLASSLYSQQKNLPLNREWELYRVRCTVLDTLKTQPPAVVRMCDNWSHSNLKPIISFQNENRKKQKKYSLVRRKIKYESLFLINDSADGFRLTIDPLFDLEYGKDLADSSKSFYKNTRGILVRGDIGSKISFESSFYENQSTFVNYIRNYNDTFLVVPGQGRWKKFKNNGYDFAAASGYVSYSPGKHFNFQIGTGKHFAGDGYRSLLLSDNAFNYPFARITGTFGKIQYTNLYTVFINLTDGGVKTPPGTEKLFQKKAGRFDFLSWNIHRKLQFGLFQGMIWQASDSTNSQCLKLSYASPLIYTAALSEGLRGKNNVLLGVTLKLEITGSIFLYGQYMVDDFSAEKNSIHNKTGVQAGVKYFNFCGVKNLHLQAEFNQNRPYSYAHPIASQSYTHYNQPLAHPLGANFKEAVSFLNYRWRDFFTEARLNYAIIGKDSIGKIYGNNIFISDDKAIYGPNSTINEMGQGLKTTLRIIDFHIGYLVNPSTNFNVVIGLSNRKGISSAGDSRTNFVYFGIRTSLTNTYYDF